MKLTLQIPKKSLSKAFLKYRPLKSEIDKFKTNLSKLLGKINEIEREENQKNYIRDFLLNTYYKDQYDVNTKDVKDLVIHTAKTNKSSVGVIIEAKRPGNKAEMISAGKLNCKAFQELVLYYLHERIDEKNIDIKYCIVTNIYEWYIFDASFFEKYFYSDKKFVKQYEEWRKGQKVTGDTNLFYNDIAGPFIDSSELEIPATYFDLRDYISDSEEDDKYDIYDKDNQDIEDKQKKLIALYKLLSPYHLLRQPFADDSNKLDEKFYKELLHIIGLEEVKEGNKHIIRRKEPKNRNAGSLLENAISKLSILDSSDRVSDAVNYGDTSEEKNFNIALELCLTWINRILFLKLLEAQLANYHKYDNPGDYKFLHPQKLKDFDELFSLFHHVLAVPEKERDADVKDKFKFVPYLNSTLFEISQLERESINISSLNDSLKLDVMKGSILDSAKEKITSLTSLEYILKFLEAYDFSSEGTEDVQEENRTLINASVLGKVFEKINGYKDGSIFTPGFITMYMCREAIRLAVTQKFRDKYNWKADNFDDIKNFIADKRSRSDVLELNEVIDSIKICDPAVGSGHFLVSSLNELIAVKSELGIFADEEGSRIKDHDITIEQDELIITDSHGDIFQYEVRSNSSDTGFKVRPESQRLQRTLFHEKQKLIENCLFGVDINPNSVKICMLRLWIELLKNAYYKETNDSIHSTHSTHSMNSELETLPNIDINIKTGNSLISRFPLDSNLSKFGQKEKNIIEQYRNSVRDYKKERNRSKKKELQSIISSLKNDIKSDISKKDPKLLKLNNLKNELDKLENQTELFEQTKKDLKDQTAKKKKLQTELTKLTKEIEDIRSNAIYWNAFEWRFEFPEVLNEEGEYEGFDVVIGNPPYISNWDLSEKNRSMVLFLENEYSPYLNGHWDLFCCFIKKGIQIIKYKGINSFILPTSFFKEKHSTELRKYFIDNILMIELIDFKEEIVFEGIARQTGIYIIKKDFVPGNNIVIKHDTASKGNIVPQSFFKQLKNSAFKTNVSNSDILIYEKLLSNSVLLGNIVCINTGVVAHSGVKSPIKFAKDDVIHKNMAKGYRKYIIGSNLSQYSISYDNDYIDYDSKKDFFHRSKFPLLFESEKIIVRRISGKDNTFIACYDDNGFFSNDNLMHLVIWNDNILEFQKPEKKWESIKESKLSLKYILSILNSSLNRYYFSKFLSTDTLQGSYSSIYPEDIRQIPIKEISEKEQEPIINLVEKIQDSKKQGKDTTALEDQIDRMVYKLYGLTEEEIMVVEGKIE